VHHGMYQPAEWSAKHIAPRLKELLLANKGYAHVKIQIGWIKKNP
jgi:hypothetical protein